MLDADVAEQHADLQTRLRNGIAPRDRLQQLLARAGDVEDVQSALSVTLRPARPPVGTASSGSHPS